MGTCQSGQHTWSDAVSAERCCNGWHQELRLHGLEPGDDLEGRTYISHLPDVSRAVFVWVRDEEPAKEAHER